MSERQLGHYRILEPIGSGGMGEVYAAQDTRLDRRVALKILPEEMAGKPERRVRFERETKAVAALNHPNIVTIYSVEECEGVHFFTMELIEGQSLAQVIPSDGLALRRFFELAIPLTDAIAAAHHQGITHRDLKPDNIRITPEGRLKVLDFGLAKLREPQSGEMAETIISDKMATQEGKIVGSVHYMSPEQAQGKEVDPRSDIFSLGILLYEMATGLRPFQGETSLSVLSSILRDTPPSVTDLRRALPRHLGRIIQRCLAKEPGGRYQTARVLRDELTELRDEIVSGSRESWPGERAPMDEKRKGLLSWRARRLRPGIFLAALAAVALLALTVIQFRRTANAPLAAETSVAVVDFRNLSQPEDLTPSTILTSLVQVGLIENSPCRVVSLEYLKDLRRRLFGSADGPIARNQALELARKGGATTLLFGDITETGEQTTFTWQLVESSRGEALGAGRISGSEYASLADEAVRGVLSLLTSACGASENAAAQIPVGEVTTESAEAYRLFLGAQRAMDELRYGDARMDLEAAVALDSSFALGFSQLAMVRGAMRDISASQAAMKRAWDLRSKLGVKDRLKLEATRASLDGKSAEYFATHEEILSRWPDDRDALQAMITYKRSRGFDEEALALSRKAIELYPDDRSINTENAYVLAGLGRLDEALSSIRRHVADYPDNPNGWDTLGDIYLKLGKPDSAAVAYIKAIETAPNFWNSHVNLALCDFLRGELASAIGRMDKLRSRADIPANNTDLLIWWSVGFYCAAGRFRDAEDLVAQRVADLKDPKAAVETKQSLAYLKIISGRIEEARALRRELPPVDKEHKEDEHSFREMLDACFFTAVDSLAAAQAALDAVKGDFAKYGPEHTDRPLLTMLTAELALKRGKPQEALNEITSWRRAHPADYTNIRFVEEHIEELRVEALRKLGREEEALSAMDEALAAAGGYAYFHYLRGQVLEKLGRGEEAAADYLKFLEMWNRADKDRAELREARSRLEALYSLGS